MICLKCGTENDSAWIYCRQCGCRLETINETLDQMNHSDSAAESRRTLQKDISNMDEESEVDAVSDFQAKFSKEKDRITRQLEKQAEFTRFGKKIQGSIDETELSYHLADFILDYPLPRTKDALFEFYVYALSHAKDKTPNDEYEENLVKAWEGKVQQLENILMLRYPNEFDAWTDKKRKGKIFHWFRH